MKTKNVKVRMQDIKQGATIYVAHPVYGINKYIIKGKPFLSKYTNSLFVKAVWDGHDITSRFRSSTLVSHRHTMTTDLFSN